MSLSKNFFHSYFVFSEYLTSFRRRWNHLILDSSYLHHGWSSFFICRFSSSKNSKNPTWKFGISTSEFSLFPRLHTFSFYVVQIFLKETFWRSKQTFKFWAVKYDPRNGPIIAHILTERYNIYTLFANWEVRILKNCAQGLEYRLRPLTGEWRFNFDVMLLKIKGQEEWHKQTARHSERFPYSPKLF